MKYDLTSDFLDVRPHVKGEYIYMLGSFQFYLDIIKVEKPRKVGPAGVCDMIR